MTATRVEGFMTRARRPQSDAHARDGWCRCRRLPSARAAPRRQSWRRGAARTLGMVGADAVDFPAHEPLHVARIVDGPGEDAGAKAVHGLHERLVQRRVLLP